MIIPAFLLKQTVTVEPFSGSGGMGPVYGPSFTEKGRIEFQKQKIKDQNGSEVVSTAVLFVRPSSAIKIQDRVTYDGVSYEVIFVAPRMGLSSPSHKEVRLK